MAKPRRTDAEVMALLREDGPYERVRKVISEYTARLETAVNSRGGIGGVELRRMEFEAVDAVLAVVRNAAPELWPNHHDDEE